MKFLKSCKNVLKKDWSKAIGILDAIFMMVVLLVFIILILLKAMGLL